MKLILMFVLMSFHFCAYAKLTNESDLAIASANGNTQTQSFTAKQANEYKWNQNVFTFKARYMHATANEVESARYFMGSLRYEKESSDHFGIFFGETLEKDKFAGIDTRVITDVGGRYRFIETDLIKLFSELGYRYMNEQRIAETEAISHYGRFYSLWEQKWNSHFSTKYWIEYLPNFTNNKDWQLNSELSVSANLNSIFFLKTGIQLTYDHSPAPGILYTTDTLFTTALVAKF